MKYQEFLMNLLISGWIKTDAEEDSRVDTKYKHVDSVFSLGTKGESETVVIFQEGSFLGTLPFEEAYTKVNDHMILMQDLQRGT